MTSTSEFDTFWAAYPRRDDKGHARIAFARALKKTTLDVMLKALDWQRQTPQFRGERRFIPLPATWLNGERWADEPFHAPPVRGVSSAVAQTQRERMQEMKRLMAEEGLTVAEAAKRVGY